MVDEEATQDGRQLVVFRLSEESYGINVESTREIFHLQNITHVPNAPEYVEGVINLRGKVVPVIDLRKRFGVEASEATSDSRIVVVEYQGEDVGLIVDAVDEVLTVGADDLAGAPEVTRQGDATISQGFAQINGELVILIDIETVLGGKDEANPPQQLETAA